MLNAIVSASKGADGKLIDQEVLEGWRGEGDSIGIEKGRVDDVSLGSRVGTLNLEGTSVGAQVGLRDVVVLPGRRGDAVLVTCVHAGRDAIGGPVCGAGFVGERKDGAWSGVIQDNFDLCSVGSPDPKTSCAVRVLKAAHTVVLVRRCAHILPGTLRRS